MRRNPELVRKLMLAIEQTSQPLTAQAQIDSYPRDEVAYHMRLIIEAGFAEGCVMDDHSGGNTTVPRNVVIVRMTNAGHDFIDSVRGDTVWNAVTEKVKTLGGSFTLNVLQQLALRVLMAHAGL